ncbi:MAG: c-type cytochrome biogenesis protein CcsB [Candidatus Aminicenantes bacterium]|nr:c-type cytochrome biogenesis protein CcsB [Candidatus Aminicenantes bacterium]
MNESTLFLITFILYIICAFFYFAYLFLKKERLADIGYKAVAAGLIVHTAALALRTVESGHAPFTNMYESLSFLAWSAALAYVVIEGKFKIRKAGPYFILIVIGLMALASSPLMPKEATPLVPALQSYWLWLHVSVTLFGEAFFAVGFITSILYLVADSREKKSNPGKSALSAERLDSISYRCIAVGFPLFTLGGLVFGMVWAYKAWGRYWSWDPKETWSLITWFFFAIYLHTRIVMGWKGRRSALIAIIGFLAAIFTYFGVNYLLAGLHSYA